MKTYYVYILSSFTHTLYIGMTNDLQRRLNEHKAKIRPGFSSLYKIDRLVYCEPFGAVKDAIAREKQLKSWSRKKKVELIESLNPKWDDLSLT